MISLQQIESDLKEALRAKDQLKTDTLRGLKSRIQNVQTAAGHAESLTEQEILALVRSEVKRRKEAAESFKAGGRTDMAGKELQEAEILQKYLPAQMPEDQLAALVDKAISDMNAGAADFGKVMGKLKGELKDTVDGGTLARLLKEKLK
jgi:uncharacterized protein